jgi:catechol 2,3-dioxygenase
MGRRDRQDPDYQDVTSSLPAETAIGAVALTVADLDRSIAFYEDRLGFRTQHRAGARATLGAGESQLLELTENRAARRVAGTTGLYHFAILVPSRLDLARSLERLASTGTPIQGASDHHVSEAIYLADPDGNGIEIYADRPRSAWTYPDGRLRMGTDALDINGLMGELTDADRGWRGLPSGTVNGHIHLHVSDLGAAEAFYVDTLGFDLVTRYGGRASFVSAGGYHHHVGLNTWAGIGAPPPPRDATGLGHFVVDLPTLAAVDVVADRLRVAGAAFESREGELVTRDPSSNAVIIRATARSG